MELLNLINEYFKDLKETFTRFMTKFPSQESKDLLSNEITSITSVFKDLQTKLGDKNVNWVDITNYFDNNYEEYATRLE